MDRKDNLFELIQSLSINEKRYFKLFASRHTIGEKNNYLVVFEAIERQKKYDEKVTAVELLKKHRIGNFRFYKHYLYKLILKSLSAFHSENAVEAQLQEQLHYISILSDKKLFSQAEKLIKKSKLLALTNERHIYLLELMRHELNLVSFQSYQGKTEKEIEHIFNDFFKTVDIVANLFEYRQVHSRVFMNLYKNARMSDGEKVKSLQHLMQTPLLRDKRKAFSKSALARFYRCKSAYYFLMCDYEKVAENTIEEIAMLESDPVFLNNNFSQYFSAYCNLFVSKNYLEQFDAIPAVLKKLGEITLKQKQLFMISFNLELGFYNNVGQFKKSIELSQKKSKELERNLSRNKEWEMEFYLLIACSYFGIGNYKLSNTYLNKILNDNEEKLNKDRYCLALIISLINQYEMGKGQLLEYLTRSAYRFLSQHTNLYKFERVMLEFVGSSLQEVVGERDLRADFKKVKTKLEEIIKDKFEKKAFLRFDFISWLDSKIERRPFADVIKVKRGL